MTEDVKSGFDRSFQELKNKVSSLEGILKDVDSRIARLKKYGQHANKPYALVDKRRCTGCGLCRRSCPWGAISVKDVACIDRNRCAGCGVCVESCPQNAIRLMNSA